MSETKYVIVNWKMNVNAGDIVAFFRDLKKYKFPKSNVQIGFATPLIYTMAFSKLQERVWVGAQDVSQYPRGNYTGEISAEMLADCGLDFCFVGQKERRQYFGETDEVVNQKLKNLQEFDMLPILFVGDTKQEREKNISIKSVVERLKRDLTNVESKDLIVVYEPMFYKDELKVSNKSISQMVEAIKKELSNINPNGEHIVLYSGDITVSNSNQLLALPEIDGVILNDDCLNAEKFAKIISSLYS